MPKPTLETAKPQMIPFFSACGRRVWTVAQLENVLAEMREEWKLAQRITTDEFVEFLLRETSFVQTALSLPSQPQLFVRYWWGTPTAYELAASLRPSGYFSHHTALYLHGLTSYEPATIYINSEQQAKGARQGTLQQIRIDSAFKRPVRVSNNCADYEGKKICTLSGKNTGQLGVVSRKHSVHGTIRLTNLGRTLIDVVVRPAYSGGIVEVLSVYSKAAGFVTAQELLSTLEDLRHAYPYHQAIGFLIEKSGTWTEEEAALFRNIPTEYNFYLDYEMIDPHYSKAWRLYYPAFLDKE